MDIPFIPKLSSTKFPKFSMPFSRNNQIRISFHYNLYLKTFKIKTNPDDY